MAARTQTIDAPDAPEPAERAARLATSAAKFVPPFALDPTMRFYSPQENVDALRHPRVRSWIRFITTRYGIDYVTLLAKDGSASQVPVQTTATADPARVEILSGASAGDTLIGAAGQ